MPRTHLLLCASLAALLLSPAMAQEHESRPYYRNVVPGASPTLQPPGGDAMGPGQGVNNPDDPPPSTDPLSIALDGAYDPSTPIVLRANVGMPYAFDFKSRVSITGGDGSVSPADLTWSLQNSVLTADHFLSFSNGVLSGTPTQQGSPGFEIVAGEGEVEGRQVYTLNIGGVIIQVTQISGGTNHSCAVTVAGGIKCWGINNYGQLGDGTNTNRTRPVNVSGMTSGVARVIVGGNHTCAVTTGGAARCWGRNNRGQVGNGTTVDRNTPATVYSSGVVSLAAGGFHTCAVVSGAARCWGFGFQGAIGDGTTSDRSSPRNVSNLGSGVASIAAGDGFSCAVLTSGYARCWGNNFYAQVGDNSTTSRLSPVSVNMGTTVTAISAGIEHACAITTAGGVKCWGRGDFGQGGTGTNTVRNMTPVDVPDLPSGVDEIHAGEYHTCALTASGGVKCWGRNNHGQLGDGTTTNRPAPVDVLGLSSGVTTMGIGNNHTCVIAGAGISKCWGLNSYSQIGDQTTAVRWTATDVNWE